MTGLRYGARMTLKEYRTSLGLSQQGMADILGCQQSYVSLLETGAKEPSREFMRLIAEKTGGAVPVTVWFPEAAA